MDATLIAEALDAVYQSATTPALWSEALRRVGAVTGTNCVSLVTKDRRTSAGHAAAWGVDEAGQREYLDVWLGRNVLHQHTRSWRVGEVETDQDILPKHEFLRSDYYNGFLKPRDMHAMLRVATYVDDDTVQTLALTRPRSAGEYQRADAEELRPLLRHVQRAALISRHLQETQEIVSGYSAALERSSTGVILLSRRGKVIFANAVANALTAAGAGLRLRGGHLSATQSSDDATLQRMIAGAVGLSNGVENLRGGAVRIAADTGKGACTVVVGPLDGRAAIGEHAPAALMLLSRPGAATSRPAWMLRSLYDLSAAETLVAERLMQGESPEQAAAALGIKTSTARWHLASLYRKTDTKRQAELVCLLLSLPAI